MTPPSTQDQPPAGQITLRYWAAARAATGTAEEQIEVASAVALAGLITGAVARNGRSTGREARISEVLDSCSILLDGRQVANQDPAGVLVEAGQTVEFLPPFAGG